MNRVLYVMKIALPDPSKSLRMYSIGLSSNSSSSTAIKHKSSIHVFFFFFLSCHLLLMTTFGRAIFSHMFFNASSLSKIGLSVSNRTKIVNTAKALQINYTKKKSRPIPHFMLKYVTYTIIFQFTSGRCQKVDNNRHKLRQE